MVFLIVATVLLGAFIWYVYHKLTFWQRQGVPTPGLLYQWHYYRRELGPYDKELLGKLGSIYGTYEFLSPVLIITDPDLIKEVLVKEFHNFPNHKPLKLGTPIFDLNLFTLEGNEDWKRIRSIISASFTSGKLRGMDQNINDAIECLKKHLAKAAETGETINVLNYYNSLSFDIVLRCAYGAQVDILSDPNHPIRQAMNDMMNPSWQSILLMLLPKVATILGVDEAGRKPFKFFEDMTGKLLEDRRNSAKRKEGPPDFLQLLVDANKEAEKAEGTVASGKPAKVLSTIEMMAQCLVFLIVGFDTTATVMACCAYHLASNPEIQEKLIAEVDNCKDLNHDTVQELKYLDAFVKENFRFTPPVIRVERMCVTPIKIGNIEVQPGTMVSIPTFALHRDPQLFSNPEMFDPERFLSGGADVNHHSHALLPFGGGPRACVAQRFGLLEAKMTLALTLKKFRFEVTPETKLNFKPASLFVLAPKDILLRVKTQ